MGKQQARLLRFAMQYPGWHAAGRDSWATVASLERHGLLEVKRHGRGVLPQFRLALPGATWKILDASEEKA